MELELPEGSLLALYTDGLIETRDHDIDVGMRRLGTALAEPSRSLEDLCTRATETSPGQAPSDDITLLLARTRSLSPHPGRLLDAAERPDRCPQCPAHGSPPADRMGAWKVSRTPRN